MAKIGDVEGWSFLVCRNAVLSAESLAAKSDKQELTDHRDDPPTESIDRLAQKSEAEAEQRLRSRLS